MGILNALQRKAKFSNGIHPDDTDTGQSTYPETSSLLHTDPAGMMPHNGSLTRKMDRLSPQNDVDVMPHIIPRYVNLSTTDVQLNNGLRNGVAAGRRIPYVGSGYLYAVAPIIPGQTRGDATGFHVRGPSPLNVQAMWEAGPGSQPNNPGGPGKIASPVFINPMTG